MTIKFLGAAGTVTGSSYVLTSASGQSLLVDLGMFQGLPEIEKLNYDRFDFDCTKLIGAVLTHAHLDHCGRLPILVPGGFTGQVWMTQPTAELVELSLIDSAKIAKLKDQPVLYNQIQVNQILTKFKTVNYQSPVTVGDFVVIFRDAGHILGSASLEILVDNQIIVFSGDMGNSPSDLLRPTEMISRGDVVVMESTYGDSLHPDDIPRDILKSEINSVESSGGTLLIPAFSLDRTQELLHLIMHLKQDGLVKNGTPVFLDSPMAVKATNIYMKYPRSFNSHLQTELKTGCPFDFPGLEMTRKRQDSESIQGRSGPKVIIAGSGMMTGGRIIDHAVHYLPRPTTRLLIVGYQGEETLGRHLQTGDKLVDIEGVKIPVEGVVNDTAGMSSHADQSQLLRWLKAIKNTKKVFVTHGEDQPRKVLAGKIQSDLSIADVNLPVLNQELFF